MKVFIGTLVHAPDGPDSIEIKRCAAVLVTDAKDDDDGQATTPTRAGQIREVVDLSNADARELLLRRASCEGWEVIELAEGRMLCPGFIDTHCHAPQYSYSGTATDKPLMEWLEAYTFPSEQRMEEQSQAKHVYSKVVKRLLLHGTTTAVYFATIHAGATKELAKVIETYGQRAFVGKVLSHSEVSFFTFSSHIKPTFNVCL